jgi:recombination protein RecA
VAPPFKTAEFDIMFDSGISEIGDLIDLAVTHEVVAKQGAWFSFGEVRLGQGRTNSITFLKDNPDLVEEIRAKTLEKAAPNLAMENRGSVAEVEKDEE